MKYNFVSLSIVLIVLLITAGAVAQPMKHGGKSMDGCRFNGLNLTEVQQQKIDALKENHFNEVSKLRDELDKMRIDKRAMMRADKLDKNSILELTKKMSELKGKIALAGETFRMNVYELLTDEQKQDFKKMGPRHERMEKRMMRHMPRNGRRGNCK